MKNARAKHAKILFFIVKYANLWGFCCRRRSGCLRSLISRELKQQRRQRQGKRHLKTNIWEMVTILLLLLLRRIPYF